MTRREKCAALLESARELIATHSTWCQGLSAVDAKKRCVDPADPAARRWDIIGAVQLKSGSDRKVRDDALKALDKTLRATRKGEFAGIHAANDEMTHAELIAVVDATIERVRCGG